MLFEAWFLSLIKIYSKKQIFFQRTDIFDITKILTSTIFKVSEN